MPGNRKIEAAKLTIRMTKTAWISITYLRHANELHIIQ